MVINMTIVIFYSDSIHDTSGKLDLMCNCKKLYNVRFFYG